MRLAIMGGGLLDGRPPRRPGGGGLRTGQTRLGRLLFPLLVLAVTAYITYQVCGVVASHMASTIASTAPGAGGALPALQTTTTVAATTTAVATTAAAVAAGAVVLPKPEGIHTVCTSNGSPYLNWQTRIMYKTYQKARFQPAPRQPAGRSFFPPERKQTLGPAGRGGRSPARREDSPRVAVPSVHPPLAHLPPRPLPHLRSTHARACARTVQGIWAWSPFHMRLMTSFSPGYRGSM